MTVLLNRHFDYVFWPFLAIANRPLYQSPKTSYSNDIFAIFLGFLDRSAVEAQMTQSMNVCAGGGGIPPIKYACLRQRICSGDGFMITGVQVE